MRGILRATDLPARQGRRVRVAGMVITRQRPGTAKGFVFLTLEDETGIANIIVRPDLFARDRLRHRRGAVPDRRRRAAEPGRRHLGPRRAGARDEGRRRRLRRPRLLLSQHRKLLQLLCRTAQARLRAAPILGSMRLGVWLFRHAVVHGMRIRPLAGRPRTAGPVITITTTGTSRRPTAVSRSGPARRFRRQRPDPTDAPEASATGRSATATRG